MSRETTELRFILEQTFEFPCVVHDELNGNRIIADFSRT